MNIGLWIAALGLPLLVYLILGLVQYRGIRTPDDFLRHRGATGLTLSLIAANLSVAGLFFGLIDGTKAYGWAILLAPVTTGIGLVLFVIFVTRRDAVPRNIGSVLQGSRAISLVVSCSMVLIFTFAAGFEVFVSSQLLFAVGGFASEGVLGQVAVALVLLLVFMSYTILGGFRIIVRTDRVQLALVGLLLVTLLYHRWGDIASLMSRLNETGFDTLHKPMVAGWQLLAFLVAILILNTATQFMSPANWLVITNAETHRQAKRVFRIAIAFLIVVWLLVIVLAFALPLETVTTRLLSDLPTWLAVVAAVGLVAATLSSVDSLMLGSLKLVRDLYDTRRADRPISLVRLRWLVPLLYVPSLLFMLVLFHGQPDLFSALLALSNGMAVFVPLFLFLYFSRSAAFGELKNERLAASVLGVLFLLTAGTSVGMVASGHAMSVVYVAPAAFLASGLILSLVLFFRGSKSNA